MATAAKFPAALSALADFGADTANIKTALLSGSHNASITTITLTATVPSEWPTAGWVTIDSEIISYTGKSGATLTGCTRGTQTAYGAGIAATHNDQSVVGPYLTAQQVNQIVAEIVALETMEGKNANIASASTTDLSAATGRYINITGTTTITAFGTVIAGRWFILEFSGILTLTHNASSLILRGGANATTAAGDVYAFVSEGSGNWRELWHNTGTASTGNNADQTNLWYWYWRTGLTVETTLSGTGAYNLNAPGSYASLSCGATSGSVVGLRQGLGAFTAGNAGAFEIRWWSFTVATDKAASEAWRLFMTDEDASTQPSLTAKHLGLRFDGTTLNFSTADGTTEQTTDVTAQFTANQDAHCVINFDGTTATLYVDGTLRATHATNVPTTTATTRAIFRAHITNSAAADKILYLSTMHARLVA